MALILTDDEQALAESVRKFVADRSPLTSLRQLMASGQPYDPDVWKQMTAQLGLAGLTAAEALQRLDDDAAKRELLPGIAAGEVIVTLALTSGFGSHVTASDGADAVTPTGPGDTVALTGTVSPVLNGAEADVLLVPA